MVTSVTRYIYDFSIIFFSSLFIFCLVSVFFFFSVKIWNIRVSAWPSFSHPQLPFRISSIITSRRMRLVDYLSFRSVYWSFYFDHCFSQFRIPHFIFSSNQVFALSSYHLYLLYLYKTDQKQEKKIENLRCIYVLNSHNVLNYPIDIYFFFFISARFMAFTSALLCQCNSPLSCMWAYINLCIEVSS